MKKLFGLSVAFVSLLILSGCATTSTPGQYTISNQCRSEARLIDSNKSADDWFFIGEVSDGPIKLDGSPAYAREYIGNRYEVDCNSIYKVKRMLDVSRVSNDAKKRFFINANLSEIRSAMEKGKDKRTQAEYQTYANSLNKHVLSITQAINPVRIRCSFPSQSAWGYASFYHHDRLLFKEKYGSPNEYTSDGFLYDGSDISGSFSSFMADLGGTTRWICNNMR